MAQAGIHGIVGMAVRKMVGRKEWILPGTILGSFVPDMDNVAVAVVTLMKAPTEGIHRMMTHSVFFMAAVVIVFYLIGQWKKRSVGITWDLVSGWVSCFTACWIC